MNRISKNYGMITKEARHVIEIPRGKKRKEQEKKNDENFLNIKGIKSQIKEAQQIQSCINTPKSTSSNLTFKLQKNEGKILKESEGKKYLTC